MTAEDRRKNRLESKKGPELSFYAAVAALASTLWHSCCVHWRTRSNLELSAPEARIVYLLSLESQLSSV